MPEDVKFSISLPDGRQTEWDQKQYNKGVNTLFEKYPDAQVNRISGYSEQSDLTPDSSFHITLDDGRETDWNYDQFSKGRETLLEKYPDAKISIVDDLTARRNRDFVHQYEYAQSKVADPSLTVAEKKQYEDFVGTHSERYEGMKDRYGDSREKDSFLKGEDTEPVTGYFARLKQNTKRMWGDILYGVGELMDINSRSYTGPSKVDTGLAKEALSLLEDREKKGEKSLQLEELLKGDTSKMSPEEKEEYNHAIDVERYLALRAGASKNTDSAKDLLTREVYGDERAKEIKEKGAKIQDENSQEGKGIAAKAADLTYLAGAGLAAIGATALGQPEIGAAIGNAAFASFAASSAGSSMRAARDAGATDEETVAAGTASAAIMYLVGRIPFLKNMKIASRATSTKAAQAMTEALSNPAVKESVMKEAGKLTKEAAEALGMTTSHYIKQILGQTASSSATFAAMNGMEALVPLIYANPEEYPVLNQVTKSVAEGAIDGAIMGALFGGVSSGSEYIARRNHIRSQMAKNGGVAAAAMDLSKGEARVWNEKTGQFEQVETPPEAGWGEILGVQKGQAQEGETPEWVHVLFNGKYYTVKSDAIARETVTLFTPKDLDKASRDAFTSEGETRGREADTPLLRGAIRQEKDYLDRKAQYEESNGGVTETTQLDIERNNAALEGRRDATLSEIVNKVGRQQFWKAKSGPDNSVINTVDVVTFEDGSQGYVVSEDESGLAVVSENGKKIISKDDPQITNRQTYDLNEYLDSVVVGQDSAAETERMASAQADNLAAVQERLVQEGKINVGTEETPIIGTLVDADITPTGGAYLQVEGEKEMRFVPWKEVASSLGMSLDAKTDAQIADDRLSGEVKAREYNKLIPMGTEFQVSVEGSEKPVDLKFKEASVDEDGNLVFTVINTETGQESPIPEEMAMQGNLGQIVESLRNPESVGTPVEETPAEIPVEDTTLRDFRGNEIPLKTDGTVDQKALWNKDPEAWAKWNDSVRQDGGANSRGYIAKATKKLQSDAKAVQKQIDNELDFDRIDQLEGQLGQINSRIADLERIENNYANAEVAQAEAMQTPSETSAPVAETTEAAPEVQEEQEPLTPDQELESRLAEAKTPEEKRQALEEYYAATVTDPTVVGTREDILQRIAELGFSERVIGQVRDQLNAKGVLTEGFHIGNVVFIVADDIRDAKRAKLAHLHEHWHEVNRVQGYHRTAADIPGATTEYLLATANKMAGVSDKNGYGDYLDYPNPQQALADEVIALSMEVVAESTAENVDENLRRAGLDNQEIINFVKTIYNGERGNDQTLNSSGRDTLSGDNAQEGERQDGGDSASQPEGNLGEQGSGSGERSIQGAGEGEQVTPQNELTKEITANLGGQIEGEGGNQPTLFSIKAIAEGVGFQANEGNESGNVTFTTSDGRVFDGHHPLTVEDVKGEKNSVMNYMMEDARRFGTITPEQEENIWQKYTDVLNRMLEKGLKENGGYENLSSQWQWVGETVFKTVSPNSDEQYLYSLDITRVCKKNEAVINSISAMQRRVGYGITPGQIMDIYLSSIEEGYQVPCPVCYVFSRYIANGKYATIAINGQKKYGKYLVDPSTLSDKEKKERIKFWVSELDKQEKKNKDNEKKITKAKQDISNILDQIDKLGKTILEGKSSEAEKQAALKEIEKLDRRYKAALNVVSQSSLTSWIKTFAIKKVKGGWKLYDDSFQGFPEEYALDLRLTAETIRKYPAIQRLRKSGGSAAGKEIHFAANNDIGDVTMMLGASNLKTAQNYYKKAVEATTEKERAAALKDATERFRGAMVYAQMQSLRGGQRMWSWSDNIERLAPDVFVNLMQLQMLGGALQSYSKQLEGANLVATMGGYVNGSLMAYGIGYQAVDADAIDVVDGKEVLKNDITDTVTEKTAEGDKQRTRFLAKAGSPVFTDKDGKKVVLLFDDVVGIDAYGRDVDGVHMKGLFDLNATLDKAGNILVGMDDTHIRAAMADDRVFFIIPWHASGQSVHILTQMLGYLGVDIRKFNPKDYTNVQEEKSAVGEDGKIIPNLVEFWEAHNYEADYKCGIEGGIPSGKNGKLSKEQKEYRALRDAIFTDPNLVNDKARMRKIRADEFLSQVWDKVHDTVSTGQMTKGDTKFIYPYEYWDEDSTYENADVNGKRYLEYCRRMGVKPKFIGKLDGNPEKDFGNFADDKGFWKLLIDRRMYAVDGSFQDLTPVSTEEFTPDLIDPEQTEREFVVTKVADAEGVERIAERAIQKEQERPGGLASVNYDMTLEQAIKEQDKVTEPKLTKAQRKKLTQAQQNVLNYLETGEFKSEQEPLEVANATQKQPVSEIAEPVVTEEDVMFRLSKNNKATVESWLKKREDINDEQRAEVVDYIDKLDDAKTQLATAKWFANGTIRIPEDMKKVEQAISVSGKAKVDPLRYNSPMELLDAHAEFKPSEERINPDEVSTLHRAAEYPDGIVVYDVDSTKESRENMRKIINTHFGEDASPWCLLQGDGKGNLTEQSAKYWKHYNAYPKQVAFKDGKLLAFSANDTHTRVWWDRQDQSHYGIPLTKKVEGDELGRSADYIVDEGGKLIIEPGGHMYRGNKQNGVYEEWNSAGDQLLLRTEYKDGKENGVTEQWYPSGQLWKRAVMKDDGYAGPYEMWYENGQQKMRVEMNERGEKDGEQVGWYKNGNKQYESRYSDGHYVGDRIDYYESGEPKSIIHYDETGGMTGFEDYVIWRGERGVKAHVGLGRRVTYLPIDSNGKEKRVEEEFRANGKLTKREEYHGSKLDGIVEYYYPDGTLQTRTHYVEGERNGTKEVYHENGKLWLRGDFKDGEVDGLQEQWNKEGDLILREEWKNGEKVRTLPLDENVQFRLSNMQQMDQDYMAAVEAGDMDTAQRMVDEMAEAAGYTIRGYHGTTHDFTIFDRSKGNAEGNWGKGFYFTNNEDDAEANYAGEGPDLTNRIELLAENMEWMDGYEDMSYEQRVEEARKQLAGDNPHVISAAIKMENPVVFDSRGGQQETFFDFISGYNEETDEYEDDPSGRLMDFYNAWNDVLTDYEWEGNNVSPDAILEYGYDGLTASQLEDKAREILAYVENSEGQVATGEFLRQVFERMGFDGIVDNNVNMKFGSQRRIGRGMDGMDYGTTHVIAFNSNQIKQTDPVTYDDEGNVIPLSKRFDSWNEDIRFRKANQTQNGFISNAQMALDKIKMDKATPEQWVKMLEKEGGLKAGEDKWLGLSDWLKASEKKTLTKDEIGDFIEQNRIQIEEVRYSEEAIGQQKNDAEEALERYREEYENFAYDYREGEVEYSYNWPSADDYAFDQMVEKYGDDFRMAFQIGTMGQLEPIEGIDDDYSDAAKYFLGIEDSTDERPINSVRLDYTTSGLENKREIALTVPTIDSWNESDMVHFGDAGEGRAIAWIRFGDTTVSENTETPSDGLTQEEREELKRLEEEVAERGRTFGEARSQEEMDSAEGPLKEAMARRDAFKNEHQPKRTEAPSQRVLVIDEIQSKRHQEAREKGGYTDENTSLTKEARDKAVKEWEDYSKELREKYNLKDDITYVLMQKIHNKATPEEFQKAAKLNQAVNTAQEEWRKVRDRVPAAPFEKNWHELAMKRMLRLAAEEGYDKIAWTTGDQQAERYNIGNTIESIAIHDHKWGRMVDLLPKDSGTITLDLDKEGKVTQASLDEFEGKTLEEIVGKGLAEKIMSAKDGEEISGDGLRVGGEGMRGFYDDILPRFMNKYGKKWGVKVQDIELPEVYDEIGHPLVMHSVDVTTEMKESVMEGQVMFSLRGIIGAENAEDEVALDNLEVAEEMEKAGKDSQTIWKATGWERGADGKWRNEIPDAKLKEGVSLEEYNTAQDVIDAPDLFKSYPDLLFTTIQIKRIKGTVAGIFAPKDNRIIIDSSDTKKEGGKTVLTDEGLKTLVHEFQHAIQHIEGFAKGGSEKTVERNYYKGSMKSHPEETLFAWLISRYQNSKVIMMLGKQRIINAMEKYDDSNLNNSEKKVFSNILDRLRGMDETQFRSFVLDASQIAKKAKSAGKEGYYKLAGEVESRNVELRSKLSEEGRRNTAPSLTAEVEEANQIVMFRKNQDAVQQSREGGLTGVIGDENAAELYRNVYKAVPKEIRQQIVDKAGDGYLFSEATKDMISEAVEKGDETGIAGLAANMLRDYAGPLDERTARYILWRGDRKVEDDDLLDTVNDIAMQRRLKVGRFAEQPMFRLADNLEENQNRANSMADDAKATLDEKKSEARKDDALTTIKAMSLQKEYDRKTVNTITVLAKNVLKDQSIDAMSRWDISRLLGFVTSSVGKSPKTVKKNADALIDMILGHMLKSEETKLGILASTRATKTNTTGVEVQGELDVRGQNVLKAYKAGLDMDLENPTDEYDENTIKGRLAVLNDRLESTDDAVRSEAEDEIAGLMLAQEYQEKVKASINEERGIRNEMKDAAEQLRDGKISRTAYNEFVTEAENSIRENRIERIDAYQSLRAKMVSMMAGSIDARKEFTEREKQRVEEIHHLANSDMQGEDASPFKESTRMGRFVNSSIVRFLSKPLVTFDQMLRLFGQKNVAGEGYLWNKFHRGWIEANENAFLGEKDAKAELDAKASEVFETNMRWSDLYAEERKMPKVKVKWWDGGEMKEHELTQGNLLYIYMVNKMTDGRMKLRRMGITQGIVDAIKKQMDIRFLELADWVQEKFLVEKRNKYNAVHERLFGASMAAIEDYFPLKINKRSLNKAEDIGRPDFDDALPATTTGSIIKRRRNAQDLDLLGADAFSVVIEHIEQMEQWAAFAEFNKDLNTLLSYKRFRNQVQNMVSVYGSGRELWNNFKAVSRIVGGTYSPAGKKSDLDTAALNVAKGVTSAKISFRVYTALKQLLSMPAFIADANIKHFGENLATPWKAWNWAMENLPMFEKRWKSRMAGDTRLMNTDSDWKFFRSQVYDTLSRLGMSPNAFVDAMTVSIGAHSIYQTRYDRYINDGYSEEEADKKAKQDATTLYNETQQSNEGAFVAPVQLDRTVLATMITVFRNSSMGYQRQLHDALRNIGKMMKPGYRAASIEFMKKQMERDGLTEEQAEHAANRNYEREKWRSAARVATFGFLVQFAWNLGGSIAYLLFGDDDDKKDEMLTEALIHGLIGGTMEGLAGGNVMSEALNMVAKGESLNNYDPSLLPIISDIKSAYKKMSYDPVAGSNDLINLAIQAGIGVNPQTLTDAVVAVVDACGGDLETSTEAMLLLMRVLQVPQSQVDQIYIDELGMNADKARTMSPGEMAERYARYKVSKGAPLTGWAYSDEAEEKREKAYLKRFKKLVNERKSK